MRRCDTCNGRGHEPFRPDVIDYDDVVKPFEPCPDCTGGWVIPDHVIEAAARVYEDVDVESWAYIKTHHADEYDEMVSMMRAALVAGLEADRDKEVGQ